MSKTKSQKRLRESKKRKRNRKVDAVAEAQCANLIENGLKLQKAGELHEAISLYQRVLVKFPSHADALHLSGMAEFSLGNSEKAIELVTQAVSSRPNAAEIWANLGVLNRAVGNLRDAEAAITKAIELMPASTDFRINLGVVQMELGNDQAAEGQFSFALEREPDSKLARMNLANLWQRQGKFRDAEESYRALLVAHLDDLQIKVNLAEAYRNQSNWDQAIKLLQEAQRSMPHSIEIDLSLGRCLTQAGQLEKAADLFSRLIEKYPENAKPCHYFGKLLLESGEARQAVTLISRAVELNPKDSHALASLGFALIELGIREQAETCFRTAVQLDPLQSAAHSALLFLLSSNPEIDENELLREHKAWGKQHGDVVPLKSKHQWRIGRSHSPARRLKIGFLSPDFRNHAVAKYLIPVLENLDRKQFEIYCYAEVGNPDGTTKVFEDLADQWCLTTGFSDEQVARKICSDEVDILLDLAGHTAKNRLRVMAYRPAPLQATWLGYPHTTGLEQVDYRITCEAQNPIGLPSFHTEELLRMPQGSFCFGRPENTPEVADLPASRNGFVTFGSLHRPEKISQQTIELWASVLQNCENSRLLLFNTRFTQDSATQVVRELERLAIKPDRISVKNTIEGSHYLDAYEEIDIALDVTPWAGATTTVEALWMGVPVIGFSGNRRSARSTVAVLKNIGHPELVANSPEEFANIAKSLNCETDRLVQYRKNLRSRVSETIMDSQKFTRQFEAELRSIWSRECELAQPGGNS